MKSTKKLLLVAMAAVLAVVSLTPSTFSWYSHNDYLSGNQMNYTKNNLPVSAKTASGAVSIETFESDKNGNVSGSAITGGIYLEHDSSSAHLAVKYYQTKITNSGSDDVMVDLETNKLSNTADFYIGTVSPTLNERAYASRASRTKVSGSKVRVYFRTKNSMSSYWGTYVSGDVTYNNNLTNDMNIAYKVTGGSEEKQKLTLCPKNYDGNSYESYDKSNAEDYVFFADIPTNTEYFYFFNHYYITEENNKNWNRTLSITDLTPGKLYYLTGGQIGESNKEYKTEAVNSNLVAINQYYSDARTSLGENVYADIGLKKTGEDENFVPEYYGTKIEYEAFVWNTTTTPPSRVATNLITVNLDGLITPNSSGNTGTAYVRTTVTGKFGDSDYADTEVSIPTEIDRFSIIKNVRVPAKDGDTNGETVVDWYVINKSSTLDFETPSLYLTL